MGSREWGCSSLFPVPCSLFSVPCSLSLITHHCLVIRAGSLRNMVVWHYGDAEDDVHTAGGTGSPVRQEGSGPQALALPGGGPCPEAGRTGPPACPGLRNRQPRSRGAGH